MIAFATALLESKDVFKSIFEAIVREEDVEERLPLRLIQPEREDDFESWDEFVKFTTSYAKALENRAKTVIGDLPVGLRHHNLESISQTHAIRSIIGMTTEQFGLLYAYVAEEMAALYPYCRTKADVQCGLGKEYCENRMKLFLCLYRLKVGCSFRQMEAVFGWAANSINEWFHDIMEMLEAKLFNFHVGILDHLGPGWREEQLRLWRLKHEQNGDIAAFRDRIDRHNHGCQIPLIQSMEGGESLYRGSLGAVDGTYSIRPRVGSTTYTNQGLNPSDDPMYTDYIKGHGYKLSVITSHDVGHTRELILHVSVHAASYSDTSAYTLYQLPILLEKLDKGTFLLGDNAYLNDCGVLPPYSRYDIEAAPISERPSMRLFNTCHSSDRISAEHGIGILKLWGAIRGRSDMVLFHTEGLFQSAVKVCWGVTNFLRLLN